MDASESPETWASIDAYRRAANDLSVGQMWASSDRGAGPDVVLACWKWSP